MLRSGHASVALPEAKKNRGPLLAVRDLLVDCKPDSVSRGRPPARNHSSRATYPREAGSLSFPIWSFSEWGLHCRRCHHLRGELLPRHFTLTGRPLGRSRAEGRRYVFCCTFPGIASGGRYPPLRPAESGLSSTLVGRSRTMGRGCDLHWKKLIIITSAGISTPGNRRGPRRPGSPGRS
jgi:hypothetical protein